MIIVKPNTIAKRNKKVSNLKNWNHTYGTKLSHGTQF